MDRLQACRGGTDEVAVAITKAFVEFADALEVAAKSTSQSETAAA
jgi:hypothetical protein